MSRESKINLSIASIGGAVTVIHIGTGHFVFAAFAVVSTIWFFGYFIESVVNKE